MHGFFQVRLEQKIHSWSGSIEVGVTCGNPDALETPFPSSATELRFGTWIMSGNSILKDGRSINENYGGKYVLTGSAIPTSQYQ